MISEAITHDHIIEALREMIRLLFQRRGSRSTMTSCMTEIGIHRSSSSVSRRSRRREPSSHQSNSRA